MLKANVHGGLNMVFTNVDMARGKSIHEIVLLC